MGVECRIDREYLQIQVDLIGRIDASNSRLAEELNGHGS
jgi:hypothetical protein